MTETKRDYTWYIEPLDGFTNEMISCEIPSQNFNREVLCQDEQPHNLWECSYSIALAFIKSKLQFGLNFKIWSKEGLHGKIRRCEFLFDKKKRKEKQKTAP